MENSPGAISPWTSKRRKRVIRLGLQEMLGHVLGYLFKMRLIQHLRGGTNLKTPRTFTLRRQLLADDDLDIGRQSTTCSLRLNPCRSLTRTYAGLCRALVVAKVMLSDMTRQILLRAHLAQINHVVRGMVKKCGIQVKYGN